MKKIRKFLLVLLAVCSIACSAFGLAGCDEGIVESLHFQKIPGKQEYRVVGLGNVSDLDIVIPSTYRGLPITEIGYMAFSSEVNGATVYVSSIEIPNTITSIGSYAFSDCKNLISIEIPESVTSIGTHVFYACDNLTSVVIPNSVTSIGTHAFYYCDNLTIYCEAESEPDGWGASWSCFCPVVWGYKGE